jgi:hypothetical protein
VQAVPGLRHPGRAQALLRDARRGEDLEVNGDRLTKRKEFVDERDGEILLGDYITTEWWPKRTDPVNTANPMKSKIFNHIVDTALGRTQMYVIDDDHLVEWRAELKSRGLADSTVEVIWNHLSSVFKSAVGKRIAKNPCREADKGVRPTGPGETKARAWTKRRGARDPGGLPALPDHRRPRHAGRPTAGEAFGFSPDDVDRDRWSCTCGASCCGRTARGRTSSCPRGRRSGSPAVARAPQADRRVQREFPPVTVTLPWQGPGNNGRPTATVRLLRRPPWATGIHPGTFNSRR